MNEYIATSIKDMVILTFIILNQIMIDIFHPFFFKSMVIWTDEKTTLKCKMLHSIVLLSTDCNQ